MKPILRHSSTRGGILILTPFILLALVLMALLVAATYRLDSAKVAQQSQADLEALAAANQMSQMMDQLTQFNAVLIQSYADMAHAGSFPNERAKSTAKRQAMAQIELATEFQNAALADLRQTVSATSSDPQFERMGAQAWLPVVQTNPNPTTSGNTTATKPAIAAIHTTSQNRLDARNSSAAPGQYVQDFLPLAQRRARLIPGTDSANPSR